MADDRLMWRSVDIDLRAPVHIGTGNEVTWLRPTATYIPGSAIRGAFVTAYIREHQLGEAAHRDGAFREFFLRGGLRFLNAYLVDPQSAARTLPIPAALQYDKYARGIGQDRLELSNRLVRHSEESLTEASWKSVLGGFGHLHGGIVSRASPQLERQYHTQRDASVGRAAPGAGPFVYEALSAGQVFRTYVLGSSHALAMMEELLAGFDGAFRIGRSRSTQYGRVGAVMGPVEPIAREVTEAALPDRVPPQGLLVTLLSHLIPSPEDKVPVGALASAFEIDPTVLRSDLRQARQHLSLTTVGGYSSVWGTPLPQVSALAAGSTLFFPSLAGHPIPRELEQLSLGLRTTEGFGRFAAAWPSDERYTLQAARPASVAERLGTAPRAFQDLARAIARQRLMTRARDEGVAQVNHEVAVSASGVSRILAEIGRADSTVEVARWIDSIVSQAPNKPLARTVHRIRVASGVGLGEWLSAMPQPWADETETVRTVLARSDVTLDHAMMEEAALLAARTLLTEMRKSRSREPHADGRSGT